MMTCGLIINELATNALKYAFPDRPSGEIGIGFTVLPSQQYSLTFWDTGVGFSENFNLQTTQSLGLRIVKALVRQLGGTLDVDHSQGCRYQITFSGTKSPPDIVA
jgi:two-component sensor histidine kinase